VAKKRGKSSATGVAALRATATLERDPAVRNPDYLSVSLLPVALRLVAKIRPLVWLLREYSKRILPGGYYFHTTRTKHIDAVLQQRAQQGMQQLVILGAGLDSRAYRFKEILASTKVFEVDYPETQAIKKKRVAKLIAGLPENVTYVPIDFNVHSLDVLLEFGYSDKLNTLFIWEGVCMYITPEAVDKVLSFVRYRSGPGSSIVFDYIFQSMVEGRYEHYGARQSAYYAAKVGEPYLFGVEPGGIEKFLEDRGFSLLSEFTPEILEQTYLRRTDGKISGRVYGYTNIVNASTQSNGT